MKSYNKNIALILSLGIMFSLCSCSKKTEETTTTETTAEDTTVEETTVEETTVTETYIPDLTEDEKIDDEESSSNVTLKRIEGTDETLLGYDNWYIIKKTECHTNTYIFYNENGSVVLGEEFGGFGFQIKDLDGDGINELISPCQYSADGANRLFVFRNNNGVIEKGRIGSSLSTPEYSEYYDEDQGKMIFDSTQGTFELTIDDFIFEKYEAEDKYYDYGNYRNPDEPLLGFTDWYSERSVSDYGYTYWYYYNKDGEMIAMQFGWNCELESNIVLKDLDGDGLKEVISICTYPANRSKRILIYRNNNGVIEEGATTDEYLSEKFGNGSELDPTNCNEYYDYETGKIMLWIKDEDNTTVELTIDDFEFNEFPGV